MKPIEKRAASSKLVSDADLSKLVNSFSLFLNKKLHGSFGGEDIKKTSQYTVESFNAIVSCIDILSRNCLDKMDDLCLSTNELEQDLSLIKRNADLYFAKKHLKDIKSLTCPKSELTMQKMPQYKARYKLRPDFVEQTTQIGEPFDFSILDKIGHATMISQNEPIYEAMEDISNYVHVSQACGKFKANARKKKAQINRLPSINRASEDSFRFSRLPPLPSELDDLPEMPGSLPEMPGNLPLPRPTSELPLPPLDLPEPTSELPLSTEDLPGPISDMPLPSEDLPGQISDLPLPPEADLPENQAKENHDVFQALDNLTLAILEDLDENFPPPPCP